MPVDTLRTELSALLGDDVRSSNIDKAELYSEFARLLEAGGETIAVDDRRMIAELMRDIAQDIEMTVRVALAERLAERNDVPYELILLLANDRIEVARPVLEQNDAFDVRDLVWIIRERSCDHQCAIAQRKTIEDSMVGALIKYATEKALHTLADNHHAELSESALCMLADAAASRPSLGERLAQRPDLTQAAATQLYEMVGDAVKSFVSQRFDIAPEDLEKEIAAAADAYRDAGQAHYDRTRAAERLAVSLSKGGHLNGAVALLALRRGQIVLFEHLLARLLNAGVSETRKVIYEASPVATAAALRASGIETTDLGELVARLRKGQPGFALARSEREKIRSIAARDPSAAYSFLNGESLLKSAAALAG